VASHADERLMAKWGKIIVVFLELLPGERRSRGSKVKRSWKKSIEKVLAREEFRKRYRCLAKQVSRGICPFVLVHT
jgi:hypothetical protein